MLTPLDSRVSDVNAEALGVSVMKLMGNAGEAVAEELIGRYPDSTFLFVCGSGNNGGDGFAAASLMDPSKVAVALLCDPSGIHSDESRHYFSALECPVSEYSAELLEKYDIIVDCALGTGSRGTPRGNARIFIDGSKRCRTVSVDVPSGLGTDHAVRPELTVTFMDIKTGMDEGNSGTIVIADIGIPFDAYRMVGPGDILRYPIPSKDSHKGDNGRLMVIAGGPYFGAPAMCSYSALRTGADIVRVFCPESARETVERISPVLMVTALPGDRLTMDSVDMLLSESERYDAVLIGPGLGDSEVTLESVRSLAAGCRVPMVIDADALKAVAGMRFDVPTVLTPHRREFEGLGGGQPEDIARIMGAVVLLKGPRDTIAGPSETRINPTGCPAMTGAGTGDVLAGCVAALLSKGMSAFDAACLGAYICGKAGEIAFQSKSYGLIATDVAECIPEVLRKELR